MALLHVRHSRTLSAQPYVSRHACSTADRRYYSAQKSLSCLQVLRPSCPPCLATQAMVTIVQWVTWAELIYMQLLTPNASFLGHLAGILAGMLHVTVLQHLPMLRAGARPFSGTGRYVQDADPAMVSLCPALQVLLPQVAGTCAVSCPHAKPHSVQSLMILRCRPSYQVMCMPIGAYGCWVMAKPSTCAHDIVHTWR